MILRCEDPSFHWAASIKSIYSTKPEQVKGRVKDNPYRYWVDKHLVESNSFKHELIKNLKIIMTNGHGVDSATITSYLPSN
ncbi:hypothetical protein [Symbiopectobacterium sp. RP]|uniref:hypothetical protein n=1 Tax=Symbiopectobacterium sp. RP TaxID=3248553 RepID=UPI003D28D480